MAHNSRDKNHMIVARAVMYQCGGGSKNKALGHYYANLHGLKVAAYDLHTRGMGYADWEVWVSWLGMLFEVKQEREIRTDPRGRKRQYSDKQYYYKQLELTEQEFHAHHPGLVAIVENENVVYDWLCLMADFVEYVEGLSNQAQPLFRLFFRKADSPEKGLPDETTMAVATT